MSPNTLCVLLVPTPILSVNDKSPGYPSTRFRGIPIRGYVLELLVFGGPRVELYMGIGMSILDGLLMDTK